MEIDLHIIDVMTRNTEKMRPRIVTILSILLAIFGTSSLFQGVYSIFSSDYLSQIGLYIGGAIHVILAIGLLKGSKWARRITIIISILNLISSIISFGQWSAISDILTITAYGFILVSLFRSKVKDYFRGFLKKKSPLQNVPIFGAYKSQLMSITNPKTINHLGKFLLVFSIFSFIIFAILISSFIFQVSDDSKVNSETRRTKNLDFNKPVEYYFNLFEYLLVLGFAITWISMYLSIRNNRLWSKTIILSLCVIYVAFGMVRLLSVETDVVIYIVYIAIQTAVALFLLFYFNKTDVEEYYQNMVDAN
jgi:hypothetical protein